VQDNAYEIWEAYANHYWPAEYLLDANGKIRRTHFGEGEYDEMENAIKALLQEAGRNVDTSLHSMPDQTPQGVFTPETYLGSKRLGSFASKESVVGGMQAFTKQAAIPLNAFAYIGEWNVQDEYAESGKNAALEFNVYTDKAFLVITPKGDSDRVKVLLDGAIVDASSQGKDVKNGYVQLNTPRLYNLIDLHGKTDQHILRVEFETEGVKIFAFTFG
jgi:hypothetical protein